MEKVKVIGFQDIKKYDVKHLINTTSRSKDWGRNFSPFFLGPVKLYDSYSSKNVENAWQFSKVYKEHVDEKGNPTQNYFIWAKKGWNDTFAHRYPMGKGAKPLYSFWNGMKLSYIEARKKIYAPIYAQSVIHTKSFKKLLELYNSNETFALLDFDGYDYLSLGMELNDVLIEENKKMGHAFVLAMLLENENLRKKYKTIK